MALACGTVLITFGIHFTDERTSVYPMFYLWVSITAFYFFSWWAGWRQITFIAVLFSVTLVVEAAARRAASSGSSRWGRSSWPDCSSARCGGGSRA